jgi:hypothetical protein
MHALRHKQTLRQQQETPRRTSTRDPMYEIDENAVPLALIEPSPVARQPSGVWTGRAAHFQVKNNWIKLNASASDGDVLVVPDADKRRDDRSKGLVNYYHPISQEHERYRIWLFKLGRMCAWNVLGKSRQNYTKKANLSCLLIIAFIEGHWSLRAFPKGYTVWCHTKGTVDDIGNARPDWYIYGKHNSHVIIYIMINLMHHTGGRSVFRSPEEFAPHLIWLMTGRKTPCICQYCDRSRSQKTITALLYGHSIDQKNAEMDEDEVKEESVEYDSDIEVLED